MNMKEIIKYHNIITQNKTKCGCGHSVIIPPNLDKIICSYCGKYIFKNKKKEFEYRLKESMNKNKQIEN